MSEQGDLARDIRFAKALGSLPAPDVPAGLADRIVRKVTGQQQAIEEAFESPMAPTEAETLRSHRWLPFAAGVAIAAGVAVALLQVPISPDPSSSKPQVAENRPATPVVRVVTVPVLAENEWLGHQAIKAHPKRPAASRPALQAPVLPGDTSRIGNVNPSDAPSNAAPIVEPPAMAVTVPQVRPTEQALMGPPDVDDLGAPMARRGTGRELGISGADQPEISGPNSVTRGQPEGRGPSGMPHF
jgi:hypothetical protein